MEDNTSLALFVTCQSFSRNKRRLSGELEIISALRQNFPIAEPTLIFSTSEPNGTMESFFGNLYWNFWMTSSSCEDL